MTGKAMGEEAGKALVAKMKALLAGKSDTGHTHAEASSSAAGLMSASDKSKLDGIATGANNYTHPTTAGYKHIPAGGSSGQALIWSAAGTAKWGSATYTIPTASSTTLGGVKVGKGLTIASGILSACSTSLYSNTTGATSVSLSAAITGFNYILVCIKNAQGAHHWVTAKAAAGDCPFQTHGVTSGTMWVVFGTLNLASKTVKITSQVNMPISAYAFGTGSSNIDCKIVQVRGCY